MRTRHTCTYTIPQPVLCSQPVPHVALTCKAVSCCFVAKLTAWLTAASSCDDSRLWPLRHSLRASGDAVDSEDEAPACWDRYWGCNTDAALLASCCILASANDLYLRTCRSTLSRSQVLCSETMSVNCLVASPRISPYQHKKHCQADANNEGCEITGDRVTQPAAVGPP